jgi:hypothetical protein
MKIPVCSVKEYFAFNKTKYKTWLDTSKYSRPTLFYDALREYITGTAQWPIILDMPQFYNIVLSKI